MGTFLIRGVLTQCLCKLELVVGGVERAALKWVFGGLSREFLGSEVEFGHGLGSFIQKRVRKFELFHWLSIGVLLDFADCVLRVLINLTSVAVIHVLRKLNEPLQCFIARKHVAAAFGHWSVGRRYDFEGCGG